MMHAGRRTFDESNNYLVNMKQRSCCMLQVRLFLRAVMIFLFCKKPGHLEPVRSVVCSASMHFWRITLICLINATYLVMYIIYKCAYKFTWSCSYRKECCMTFKNFAAGDFQNYSVNQFSFYISSSTHCLNFFRFINKTILSNE
jgi:hypothetical protein